MHWDFTINPGYLVTWGIGLGTLLWKLSAWIAEMRSLVTAFGNHEKLDHERFAEVRDEVKSLRSEVRELREMLLKGR